MPLAPGTELGPYEINELLGSGGMGEVYRARDCRLDRNVALKILPRDFCADQDRRLRFEREARASGQLNHPNVLAILDVGNHDDFPFIVTELLEGESLRQRLQSGPLPQCKSIEIASQIARGLGAAHEKGIVHRDIKPDNIFICSDGQVKILDFGLARLSSSDSSRDATLTLQTSAGIVLGTAAYMSPEQARGQAADARSDIFSLGGVLYEMLSACRPFTGDTYADLVSAILHQDPPPFPPNTKILPSLDRIVRRCLEKSAGERFQTPAIYLFNSTPSFPQLIPGAAPSCPYSPPKLPSPSAALFPGSSPRFSSSLPLGFPGGSGAADSLIPPRPQFNFSA